MVGLIPDLGNVPTAHFRQPGERVVLLGADRGEFGGSAYLRLLHGVEAGRPPAVDLDAEARLARLLRAVVAQGLVRTAHDLAEGGLAVALAEATFDRWASARGSPRRLAPRDLFSETQARALVACSPRHVDRLLALRRGDGRAGARGRRDRAARAWRSRRTAAASTPPSPTCHRIWTTALPAALGL